MLSYAEVTSKHLLAPMSSHAPSPPKCPEKLETTELKRSIKFKKGKENSCGVEFGRVYLEHRLSQEIETNFSNVEHHESLQTALTSFKNKLKNCYPESQCWLTGSFAAGIDTAGSDLDFTIRIPSMTDGTPFQKLMAVKHEIKYCFKDQTMWVQKASVSILQLKHKGVSIDVSIDNDSGKKNTQLLCWYGQMDRRYPLLCKAMKTWASRVGVSGAKYGRLNSFSLCLMMIHFLQVKPNPPVLPNIQKIFPELNDEFLVENDHYNERNLKEEIIEMREFAFDENEESLATLFLGFLKYYSEFDFVQNWISVKNGKLMKKEWDENKKELNGMPEVNKYIVVEDPFLKKPRNCACSVRQEDFMERIQLEFEKEYERILKKRTIFTKGPSIWKKKLIEEGKRRDNQIIEVFNDINQENHARIKLLDWGEVDLIGLIGTEPHPEEYWEETSKSLEQEEVEEWPILIPIFHDFYDWIHVPK